jgi:hypothetical protein
VEGRGHPHNVATLSMEKEALVLMEQETGCAPQPVWALCRKENFCPHCE